MEGGACLSASMVHWKLKRVGGTREYQIGPFGRGHAKRRERIEKLPLCIRGTWDSEVIDELHQHLDDFIVENRGDSVFQETEFGKNPRQPHRCITGRRGVELEIRFTDL
jgi:nicotinamidase-related amidase